MSNSLIVEVSLEYRRRFGHADPHLEEWGNDAYYVVIPADETITPLYSLFRRRTPNLRFNYVTFNGNRAAETLGLFGGFVHELARDIVDVNHFPLARIQGRASQSNADRIKEAFSAPWHLQLLDMNDTTDSNIAHHIYHIHRQHRRRIEHITGNHSNRIERITSYK